MNSFPRNHSDILRNLLRLFLKRRTFCAPRQSSIERGCSSRAGKSTRSSALRLSAFLATSSTGCCGALPSWRACTLTQTPKFEASLATVHSFSAPPTANSALLPSSSPPDAGRGFVPTFRNSGWTQMDRAEGAFPRSHSRRPFNRPLLLRTRILRRAARGPTTLSMRVRWCGPIARPRSIRCSAPSRLGRAQSQLASWSRSPSPPHHSSIARPNRFEAISFSWEMLRPSSTRS